MYKKVRYVVRLTTAIFSKYYLAIILGIVLGIATFLGLPPLLSRLPYIRPTQTIALVGRVTEKDLPPIILQKLSVGLTTIGSDGLAGPGMAQSWEATDSGKQYIFTLSPYLVWHDKTPLKSRDLALSFKDAEIEYPSDDKLVIKLKNPFSPLATIVSRPIFKSSKTGRLVGVGSYKLKGIRKNGPFLESITLTPNHPDSKLPILKYNFYATQSQARTALKLSLVNSVQGLSDIADLASWPNVNVITQVATDRHVILFFDTTNISKNLRLALTYAITKTDSDKRSLSPLAPTSWAYNKDVRKYDTDLKKAKELLSKVEKVPSEINLTSLPVYEQTATSIKADWEALGLKVNLKIAPDIPTEYQTLLVAQIIPTDPDQYNFWHSTQVSTNLSHFNNPRIDKLLEDGRKTLDQSERKKIYYDFQRFLLDESPAVFLYFPKTYAITKN